MSYTITYTCEWCGKEHTDGIQEIRGHRGSTDDFTLADLCDPCYKKVRRALKTQCAIHTGDAITFNQWLLSVVLAAAVGAFISFVIQTL